MTSILALLTLLVAAPLNWFVVLRLWNLYRATPYAERTVVRDRLVVAVFVAVIVTVFGLIFVQNDLAQPILGNDATKLLTRSALLVGGIVTAGYFLWTDR